MKSFFLEYLNLLIFIYFGFLLLESFPEVTERFSSKNEVYLISPLGGGLISNLGSYIFRIYPPFFVVLKALTPKNYTFREFYSCPIQKHFYAANKLVCITCFTNNSLEAYKVARNFKEAGSKVVMGGPHVMYLPDEALEYCDSVVIGEVESIWKEVVRDYENNSLRKKYIGVALEECHDLVHQELLNSSPEVIKSFLETTRGCKFKCRFCTIPSISGGKVRTKPVFDVVELIDKIKHKYKSITFLDNNIYSDPAYAKELFKALKPLNIKWTTHCTIDIAKNSELLKLAKESGCEYLFIGFEIIDGSFEKEQGGKFAMAQKYTEYARKIKEMGIKLKVNFMFGFESDSFWNLFKIWKFSFLLKPSLALISILTPFPGTPVYEDMIKQDRIKNLNWRNYTGQSLVFEHPNLRKLLLLDLWLIVSVLFMLTSSRLGQLIVFLSVISLSLTFLLHSLRASIH